MSEHNRLCGSQPDANKEQQHSQPKFYPPAPWKCHSGRFCGIDRVEWEVEFPAGTTFISKGVADLIEAAPEMYEALKKAEAAIASRDLSVIDEIRAALAKAKGGAA